MENTAYEPDWVVYFCHIEENPAFIGLDLNLKSAAPVPGQPNVLEISIPLLNPGADGFPADTEWEALGEMEDAITEALEVSLQAVFVGKTLNNGFRKFYFYAAETFLLEHYVSEAMASFPDYSFEATSWEDPEWETYLEFLYPEPADLQRIQNNKVLQHLEENGDDSSIPRKVHHWLYFKREETRDRFWQAVELKGYTKEAEQLEPDLLETPYKLEVSFLSRTEEEPINEMVLYLWQLAQEFEGEYDGWETSIESGEEKS